MNIMPHQIVERIFEDYKFHIEASPFHIGKDLKWFYFISKIEDDFIVTGLEHPEIENPNNIPYYETRNDAYLAGIDYVLDNLI